MSTTRLFLSGITTEGRHGANPGEKDAPQRFVVDLDLEVEVSGDDIEATADYRGTIETVREIVADRSFDLIESLATEIAKVIVAERDVLRATAVVHKPGAALELGIDGVAAAATAE
ncbi:MAG: dihydroneopterin aldolase [Actinomycetota bacterium]